MSIMSDNWIKKMAESENMISPFVDKQVRTHNNQHILSYGLSSYGYDARVSNEFKIFTNTKPSIIDPKKFDQDCLITKISDICIIPPNSFALGTTIEYFKMPRDVIAICIGKSTYARCGIIINVTPLEPECEGHITLEFSNTTPLPAKIYAGEGACQFLFLKGDQPCNTSYLDRYGRYTKQIGVTLPTV